MDLVADIKQRLSIEDLVSGYVTLRKSGRNFKALCPFHSEKTPSFHVSVEKQIAYCFGCQKGGDIFQFYQEAEGADFSSALKALAEKAGLDVSQYHTISRPGASPDEKQRYYDVHEFALKYFQKHLWEGDDGAKVLEYVRQRGLADETIREWGLGFSPDGYDGFYQAAVSERIDKTLLLTSGLIVAKDSGAQDAADRFRMRLMFPIRDVQGRVIAFGGRTLKKGVEPKYLNSPETPLYRKSEVLFGFSQAKSAIRSKGIALLVEGYMDALACHQAGIQHVVAASGTAFTLEHARILKRITDKFFLCFDNDSAGWEATKRAYLLLQSVEASVYVVDIPHGKDPAEALTSGREDFLQAIEHAQPFFDAYLERSLLVGTLTSERVASILAESLEYIRVIQNKILKDLAIRALASKLSVRETLVYDELKRITGLSRQQSSLRDTRNDLSDPVHAHLKRLKPEELLLVCALRSPDKVPEIFEKLHSDDFSEDIRPVFVRVRDLVAEGRDLDFSSVADGFPETLQARIQYYLVYGESFYDELPLDVFEKDVKTALDKVIQNRKNVQLGALKGLIRHYQHEGKKSELILALEQLREQLKN